MTIRKTREELDAKMPGPAVEPPTDDSSENISEESGGKLEDQEVSRKLKNLVESLLFAAGDPISLQALLEVAHEFQPTLTSRALKQVLESLRDELEHPGRGIRLTEVAGGFQLRTPVEAAPYIKRLVSRRPPRLTRASLETLAVVAYRQPVTRGEVEEIRGVDSGAVLKALLEKKLIKIMGRKDEPGRPLLYGTTKEFLTFFSLKDLSSLPTLRDFVELSEEHRASLGLTPAESGGGEAEPLEDALRVELTDAYAPVGDDQVVQDLAEALAKVRKQDRRLKQVLGVSAAKEPQEESGAKKTSGEKPPPEGSGE